MVAADCDLWHWVHRLGISASEQQKWMCAVMVRRDYYTDLFSSDHGQQKSKIFKWTSASTTWSASLHVGGAGWAHRAEPLTAKTPTCQNAISSLTPRCYLTYRRDLWNRGAISLQVITLWWTFFNVKTDPLLRSLLTWKSLCGSFISLPC